MILPPDGDMWEGKLILGNPRRRIHALTDIVKLWEEGVKQAHEAHRAYERHNIWGTCENNLYEISESLCNPEDAEPAQQAEGPKPPSGERPDPDAPEYFAW